MARTVHSVLFICLMIWGGIVAPIQHALEHADEFLEELDAHDGYPNDQSLVNASSLTNSHQLKHQEAQDTCICLVCICMQNVLTAAHESVTLRVPPALDLSFADTPDRIAALVNSGPDRSRAPPVFFM